MNACNYWILARLPEDRACQNCVEYKIHNNDDDLTARVLNPLISIISGSKSFNECSRQPLHQ